MRFWLLIFILLIDKCVALPIRDMSIEEKVGQLLMVHFHGEELNAEACQLMEKAHVGGFIFYNWANGEMSFKKIGSLLGALQKKSKIPLFLAVDQEGGAVCRLKNGFTQFPSNRSVASAGSGVFAYLTSLAIAEELKQVGFNMNFAPVVDIDSTGIMGIRSFGSTLEEVLACSQAALKGYETAGILAVLKHYPGIGGVERDPHEDFPKITKSKEELLQKDLAPFVKLKSKAKAIMTSHVAAPAIATAPTTTSQAMVGDLLLKEIGFKGLVITDSLCMEGLLKSMPVEQAAKEAILAGHDILLLGGKQLLASQQGFEFTKEDIFRIHSYLVNAVKRKEISENRIDRSVTKILKAKRRYLGQRKEKVSFDHVALGEKIAKLSAHFVKGEGEGINSSRPIIIAPDLFKEEILKSSFGKLKNCNYLFYPNLKPKIKLEELQEGMAIIFFYGVKFNPEQIDLLKIKGKKIAIALKEEEECAFLKDADVIISTMSPDIFSIEEAYQKLKLIFVEKNI